MTNRQYTNPFRRGYVIPLLAVTSLIGAFITTAQKTFLQKYDIYTITYIDTVLTCIFLSIYAVYQRGFYTLHKNITHISSKDLLIFVVLSMAIAGLVIIGRHLLKHNDMSYLGIMDTGIDVFITVVVAMLFLKEKITISKIVGLAIILLGAYIVNK